MHVWECPSPPPFMWHDPPTLSNNEAALNFAWYIKACTVALLPS